MVHLVKKKKKDNIGMEMLPLECICSSQPVFKHNLYFLHSENKWNQEETSMSNGHGESSTAAPLPVYNTALYPSFLFRTDASYSANPLKAQKPAWDRDSEGVSFIHWSHSRVTLLQLLLMQICVSHCLPTKYGSSKAFHKRLKSFLSYVNFFSPLQM